MFENKFCQERYIIIYIFHGCLIEILTQIPAHVPREKCKRKFRRKLKEVAIYITSTSEFALSIKYSEYADIFFKNKINNISLITRTKYVINFEKISKIFYKFIYYFSERERELIILK
jgi:hypothetical protein